MASRWPTNSMSLWVWRKALPLQSRFCELVRLCHRSNIVHRDMVVVPLAMQHYLLLHRNLVYTAMTRGRRLVVLVGQRKALAIAVRNDRAAERFSCLYDRLVISQIDPSGRSYSN